MSLATRCTACGTVFRVVQDQLRVSEGWVRCGRCTEVFNAVDNLVDPPLRPGAAGSTASTSASSAGTDPRHIASNRAGNRAGSAAPAAPAARFAGDLASPAAAALPGRSGAFVGEVDLPLDDAAEAMEFAAVRPDAPHQGNARADGGSDISADPNDRYGASSLLPSGFEPSALPAETAAAAAARTASTPMPSFVRRADRAARWQRPRVRAAMAAVSVLALVVLLGQVAHSYRDLLAARWPATQPLLAQACTLLGCTVQAPRLIDALVVDSSGLLRVERSDVYKLTVTLRNQDALAVAVPALDLSLTDTQGRQIARRVLYTHELGSSQTRLEAGAELALQATLRASAATTGQAVAGYTIDIFYP